VLRKDYISIAFPVAAIDRSSSTTYNRRGQELVRYPGAWIIEGDMMYDVAVVKYEKPLESLRKAVDLAGGLGDVSRGSKVVIKPNLVAWLEGVEFLKYGVIATARLIEDMVTLLKEQGAKDIAIAEGIIDVEKENESIFRLAVKGMGLDMLEEKYGVKLIDVQKGSFTKVTVGDVTLSVNTDILDADYVVNMPVLKTHGQAMVSLGIKNLKGVLNISSRKKCHNRNYSIDLDYHISKLPQMIRTSLTVIDGIYTLEKGPLWGEAHRADIIIASKDLFSADKVGATILGIAPQNVPHLVMVAKSNGRPIDLNDINIRGETDIRTVTKSHEFAWPQNESGDMPLVFELMGIRGIRFPLPDNTLCTYCGYYGVFINMGILAAKNRDKPFDDIEILTGKIQEPTPGHKHTLLFGQCQVKKNGKNPLINHCVEIKGCPPSKQGFFKAFEELEIELPDDRMEWWKKVPEFFTRQYAGRQEFDPALYRIQ
jgi:uncharacterized protein (DUF362 family)